MTLTHKEIFERYMYAGAIKQGPQCRRCDVYRRRFVGGAGLDHPGGRREPASLIQTFRVRDGQIAVLRDYFTL